MHKSNNHKTRKKIFFSILQSFLSIFKVFQERKSLVFFFALIALIILNQGQSFLNAQGQSSTDKKNEKKDDKKQSTGQPTGQQQPAQWIMANGFGGLAWGTNFATAKGGLVGEVKETVEGDFIVTRQGEVMIHYGFFKDPDAAKNQPTTQPSNQPTTQPTTQPGNQPTTSQASLMTPEEKKKKQINDEAKLFYVTLRIPYLLSKQVEEKLTARFGKPTGSQLKKEGGVIWWDQPENLILVWVDAVSKNQYTRKIDIIGKKMREQVMQRQKVIYSTREQGIIKDLNF